MRLRFDSPSFVSHHSFSRSSKNRTEKLVLVLRVRKKKKTETAKKRMEARRGNEREKETLLERESVVESEGMGALIRGRGGNDTRILLKLFHFNNYETELNTAWTDCKLARFAILIAIGCRHK